MRKLVIKKPCARCDRVVLSTRSKFDLCPSCRRKDRYRNDLEYRKLVLSRYKKRERKMIPCCVCGEREVSTWSKSSKCSVCKAVEWRKDNPGYRREYYEKNKDAPKDAICWNKKCGKKFRPRADQHPKYSWCNACRLKNQGKASNVKWLNIHTF